MSATRAERHRREAAARKVVAALWRQAPSFDYDGRWPLPVSAFRAAPALIDVDLEPLRVGLTFDFGHHTGAWFKNSQYEQCWHFTIGGTDHGHRDRLIVLPGEEFQPGPDRPKPSGRAQVSEVELRAWAELVFPGWTRFIWRESPKYLAGIVHLRVFVDQERNPIIPQGEVYSLIPFEDGSSPERVYSRLGS
jgi:hypothetical protein